MQLIVFFSAFCDVFSSPLWILDLFYTLCKCVRSNLFGRTLRLFDTLVHCIRSYCKVF